MPCQDKTSLLCMPCETLKQYALVLCSRVCLLLYTVSKERKEADTQRACRCFHILCVFFFFFLAVCSFYLILRTSVCLHVHHLIGLCYTYLCLSPTSNNSKVDELRCPTLPLRATWSPASQQSAACKRKAGCLLIIQSCIGDAAHCFLNLPHVAGPAASRWQVSITGIS